MTRIEIIRGTNPTIKLRLKGLGLKSTFDQTIDGDTVTRHCYFTIRHNPSAGALNPDLGEMQIEMDSTGHVVDDMGNDFKINNTTVEGEPVGVASVALSRTYTRTMHVHEYLMQFNLIDNENNMFAVDEKPIILRVVPNVVDLTGDET